MKYNFITQLKAKSQAKKLKKDIINAGKNKDYIRIYHLITSSENSSLYLNNISFALLCVPAVVRALNEANEHFIQENESEKAYTCFSYSLKTRNRQRENIDLEIERNINTWQLEKLKHLSIKGYEAYKHTRYLAIQALVCRALESPRDNKLFASITQTVNNYIITGKLKGFYLFYLKDKLYSNSNYSESLFLMLRKGIRDPLINRLIIAYLYQSQQKEKSASYIELYLSVLVESTKYDHDLLSVRNFFSTIPSLPKGDEKSLLVALQAAENNEELPIIERHFFNLKKASSRYYFIRLVSGEHKESLIEYFSKNACCWKTPTFVAKLFKQLFDGKCYNLVIDIFNSLPSEHCANPQIFTFYIGSLRCTDQVQLAQELLKSAPIQVSELTILTQQYYLYKKEKNFSKALQIAEKVYELQPEKNKQRWAFAIVELMGADGDFESARSYIAKHPQYAAALQPLIHFQEGTLCEIENELKTRIMAGEHNDELHYYLSYLYCERKNYPKAVEQITEAIALKVSRRNALHYLLLKSIVEKDYSTCLSFIQTYKLDSDVLFAKYYAHFLIQSGALQQANEYLNKQKAIFNATIKGRNERKLLLANSAKLAGDNKKAFELFSSIFPEEQRCFTSTDKESQSFAVMHLKSTAPIIRDDTQPLISVIMTNFGWSEYTPVAIQSILDQTHSNFEFIIIDDHSEKNAYRKLAKFIRGKKDKRIKLIRLKKNLGTYRAKNQGLSIAKGEYITFQDSDDWSHPERFKVQLTNLNKKTEVVATVCSYIRINYFGLIKFQNSTLYRKGFISLFIRKIVLERIGYFDSVRTSADSEYYSRIETYFSPGSVFYHETSMYLASYNEKSLTTYGLLSIDPIVGLTNPRKKYRKYYSNWHKKCLSGDDLFLPKQQNKRKFNAPNQMIS